jgi:rod shape-determining protein MreD
MAANADVQRVTLLTTSGVDGVYPPGLPVAGWPRWSGVPTRHLRASTASRRHWWMAPGMSWCSSPCRCRSRRAPPADDTQSLPPARRGQKMIMRPGPALLLPANPLFIWGSLLWPPAEHAAMGLGRTAWMPDCLALVLVFWSVHQPLRVGIGFAFVFGLCMDVHQAGLLGQHALAYTALSFFAITIHRRLLWFSVPSQAVQVLPLFVAAMPSSWVRMMGGGVFRDGCCCWHRDRGAAVARGQRGAAGAAARARPGRQQL